MLLDHEFSQIPPLIGAVGDTQKSKFSVKLVDTYEEDPSYVLD